MNPITIYFIGVVTVLFIGAFFIGVTTGDPIADGHVEFLVFCSFFWPITVPLFGMPLALYLLLSAIYDLGIYLGKKLNGGN